MILEKIVSIKLPQKLMFMLFSAKESNNSNKSERPKAVYSDNINESFHRGVTDE